MKCDIYEEDNNYVTEMDVPGFKKEDINMELEDGYLKISAEKKSDSEEKDGKKYVRRERHCYSKCERQFYVGNIKDEDIKAKFKDGILKISVPKEEEKKGYLETVFEDGKLIKDWSLSEIRDNITKTLK